MLKQNSLLLLLAALFFGACTHTKTEKAEIESKLLVSEVFQMDTSVTKKYVCQIRSIQHIELRALEKGYLQNIYVDEGQTVHKGQLLFQIMPVMYKAELEKAQAEANYAEIEFKNTKSLADKNIVSVNELALAKAKLDKAKAELAVAQVHLSFTEIKAPFDGIMDRLLVRQGSLLDEGALLTTLADNSKMWVYFNVPEAEYLNYASLQKEKQQQVQLLMANNQIFDQKGIVETIEADFDNETGNIPFRATFSNNKGLLRHGETGNILITVPFKNALIIPQKATYEVLDKKYVFVVDDKQLVHTREITVAAELPDLYLVQAGLTKGEKVLIEGIRKVKNDEKITYDLVKPAEVLSQLKLHAE